MKTAEGIRIVTLGGALDTNVAAEKSTDKYLPFHCTGDANILKGANSADILLTTAWPDNIQRGSKVDSAALDANQPSSNQSAADLCAALKPRYHFSTSTAFYEREPFFHPPSTEQPDPAYRITRFISLATFGNASKQKWIYAFTLDPTAAPPTTLPQGTTPSPFPLAPKKRPLPSQSNSFSRFSTSHDPTPPHRGPKRQKLPPPGPDQCFFCLSNPRAADHLVVSIGTEAYLTTSKGPLSTAATFPDLPFPAHILLITMAHEPTLAAIPADTRAAAAAEMRRYRDALDAMLHAKAAGRLGSVAWEVSRSRGVHAHWQYMPLPAATVRQGLASAAFKVEAENLRYPAVERSEAGDGEESGDCFNVWTWAAGVEGGAAVREKLTLPLDEGVRFDVQMGRRVVAKLLGLESRMRWQDCAQEKVEEEVEAGRFREAFREFDFSLVE